MGFGEHEKTAKSMIITINRKHLVHGKFFWPVTEINLMAVFASFPLVLNAFSYGTLSLWNWRFYINLEDKRYKSSNILQIKYSNLTSKVLNILEIECISFICYEKNCLKHKWNEILCNLYHKFENVWKWLKK